jgi:acyl dehydratase
MGDVAPAASMQYFEDQVVGSVFRLGSIAVNEEEMIAFAKRYDPQVFHTDPEAAKKTAFGGLIASGWLTGSLAMRMIVEHRLVHVANFGSPGIDEVRWPKPVRPGDVLSVRLTIVDARRSRSKPDRGIVTSLIEVLNQSGEAVMTWKGTNIVRCRND